MHRGARTQHSLCFQMVNTIGTLVLESARLSKLHRQLSCNVSHALRMRYSAGIYVACVEGGDRITCSHDTNLAFWRAYTFS